VNVSGTLNFELCSDNIAAVHKHLVDVDNGTVADIHASAAVGKRCVKNEVRCVLCCTTRSLGQAQLTPSYAKVLEEIASQCNRESSLGTRDGRQFG
jgi:hypothetical protein